MSAEHRFKLVVVGGGAGGCATAHKFVSRLGGGEVCVIEPSSDHFYQPMWTLVGGGVKTLEQSVRPMQSLLPRQATWLRDSVETFHPDTNTLLTAAGDTVSYDWLVIATGIQLRWQIQIHIQVYIQIHLLIHTQIHIHNLIHINIHYSYSHIHICYILQV